jgi:hypothetical protein
VKWSIGITSIYVRYRVSGEGPGAGTRGLLQVTLLTLGHDTHCISALSRRYLKAPNPVGRTENMLPCSPAPRLLETCWMQMKLPQTMGAPGWVCYLSNSAARAEHRRMQPVSAVVTQVARYVVYICQRFWR